MIKPAAGVPPGTLVAVCRDSTRILDHSRQMQQIPGHESRVAVGKIVLGPARPRIEVRRAWSYSSQPARIGLRRDDVAKVLERIEDIHGAVFGAV